MADDVITPVVTKLIAKIDALATSEPVKGYDWARVTLDQVPAAIVGMPAIRRTDPNDREPEMRSAGANSVGLWTLTFPTTFYVDLGEIVASAALLVELVVAFVKSIDTDPTLDGLEGVGNSGVPRVVDGESNYDRAKATRPLLAYDLEVVVPRLVIP